MNPVDYNIWAVMQDRVYEKRVNDVEELCQRLLSVWHSIGQNVIDEAIDQWRARLTVCVQANGAILCTWCKIDLNWMLVLWLDILSQFWFEWPCCISTHLTFQVSQGSAATALRWGENFNTFLFCNSLLYIAVKKLRKSVIICLSYRKKYKCLVFYGPRCILRRIE